MEVWDGLFGFIHYFKENDHSKVKKKSPFLSLPWPQTLVFMFPYIICPPGWRSHSWRGCPREYWLTSLTALSLQGQLCPGTCLIPQGKSMRGVWGHRTETSKGLKNLFSLPFSAVASPCWKSLVFILLVWKATLKKQNGMGKGSRSDCSGRSYAGGFRHTASENTIWAQGSKGEMHPSFRCSCQLWVILTLSCIFGLIIANAENLHFLRTSLTTKDIKGWSLSTLE